MGRNKLKLGLGVLTVLATPIAVNTVASSDALAAQGWVQSGSSWYYYHQGQLVKNAWVGSYWLGTDGKLVTNAWVDNGRYYVGANGVWDKNAKKKEVSKPTVSSVPTRGYANGVYYVDSKPANWWYNDGQAWYFFQNGKKLTGTGQDNAGAHYFVNGKYANGKIGNKEYRDGKEVSKENKVPTRGYANGVYYVDSKPANWWYDDGNDWYFFQNGKKLTGYGQDNAGAHYFVNGKYANGKVGNKEYRDGKEVSKENKVPTRGYANGVYYVDSKPANWWYDDGNDWYFFQNGKKLTGYGQDNAGAHYFVNGKYANGKVGNKEYRDGKEVSKENKVPTRGYANGVYYVDSKPANWWYDDGNDWYFFQNGKKLTGYGQDNAGAHYFVNGKYANGKIGNKEYRDGKEVYGNTYSSYYKVKSLYIPVYDANGRILSHVSKDTVLFRDNRSTVNGRIPVQVAGLTGYVNASQVTAVDSSNTFIPDYVSDGMYVYHRYSPYTKVMVAYHNANMQVGKSYYSADGINFGTFKLDHPFQFSNLKSRTNYTATDINRLYNIMGASDSKLAGKGATFKAAEQRYGVNALYLVAHSALESAWGRSKIAKDKNNFFGISAYDDTPYTSATKFDDVDSGILGAARWINSRYLHNSGYPANGAYLGNKAGGMNVNYATAPYWGESIASIMFSANEKLGRKDR